jgi:hypothetical protein
MTTYTRIQGYFMYFYVILYGFTAVIGFFDGLFRNDGFVLVMSMLFVPIGYLLHLLAQAHFRLARRADNYINFCKATGIDDDKEHSEKFFRQFKSEIK